MQSASRVFRAGIEVGAWDLHAISRNSTPQVQPLNPSSPGALFFGGMPRNAQEQKRQQFYPTARSIGIWSCGGLSWTCVLERSVYFVGLTRREQAPYVNPTSR